MMGQRIMSESGGIEQSQGKNTILPGEKRKEFRIRNVDTSIKSGSYMEATFLINFIEFLIFQSRKNVSWFFYHNLFQPIGYYLDILLTQ